jgi:ubiquinone/menaquinone biosynthesis C-methylase UbiE
MSSATLTPPPAHPNSTAAQSTDKWRDIWVRKGVQPAEKISLMDIVAYDGHDTGGGKMSEKMWLELHASADRRLQVKAGERLLEVGCGAGAFLYPFAQKGAVVSGIDYSPTLLEIARRVLPGGTFHQAEANRLPHDTGSFDKLTSMGVFMYFPGWPYAEQALDEMIRVLKPGGRALVLDINDAAKMEMAEGIRERNLGAEKYRELYRDLRQMYYPRDLFRDYAQRRGLKHELFDQALANYDSAQWRFNFYFEKP